MTERNIGNADGITREYLDSLLLEMRHIDNQRPNTEFQLYGKTFATPIMTAALSHLDSLHEKGTVEVAKGAKLAKAVNWTGMGDEQELEEITKTGAETIKIIKPYADNEMILEKIAHAKKCGVIAVGIDIDHAFGGNGEYDVVQGYEMRPKTLEEIKSFVKATDLPFIIKGVLSDRDAYKCLQAGVKGIVVSHHHGIMDYAVPPLQMLPAICKVINGEIPIFVDCGISDGMDAYKALALGATAVCVGRAVMEPLKERGAEGVKDKLLSMTGQLRGIMAKTGCSDLQHMDASVIRKR